MRTLLWKELRENAHWAGILFAGVAVSLIVWAAVELPGGRIDESITSDEVLGILLIAAPLGALALGFLQTLPELQRDAWAFLIHRPVSATRIFLAKTIVGTGIYLTALLVPFLLVALWAAAGAPEHRVFHPLMLWPGVTIVLASAGFHGAAMLVALRPARWLGTRILPLWVPSISLALTFAHISSFSEIPSPALLLFILAAQLVTTLAAWGSFIRGGEATGQPMAARVALGLSLGLGALAILGTVVGLGVGAVSELLPPRTGVERRAAARAEEWDVLSLLPTQHLIHVQSWPGRGRAARYLYGPQGHGAAANHWIQSADGLLYGYREERSSLGKRSFHLVRIVGPDGFREPPAMPGKRFGPLVSARWPHRRDLEAEDNRGEQLQDLRFVTSWKPEIVHREVLVCAAGIYDVDFAREEVRLILAAPEGEPIRGATVDKTANGSVEIAIATDRSVRFFSAREEVVGSATNEATGERADLKGFFPDREIFKAAIPADIQSGLEGSLVVGRVPGRDTCVFASGRETRTFAPERLMEADASGKVLRRRDGLDGGSESKLTRAALLASAAFTPLALAGAAALADEVVIAGDGPGLLRVGLAERPGWAVGLVAILALQAIACAAAARAVTRRHGFSPASRRLWTALGALLGPAGLAALSGMRDWSAVLPCGACGRRRAVSIVRCPHCGAGLEPPPRDGTEVIESSLPAESTAIHTRSLP